MDRAQKAVAIKEITADINESEAIFVVDYRGMTVPQAAELRTKLREADTSLRVVKNTLTELAADAADAGDLKAYLVGPTAIAFVRGDAALAAKALAEAQKEHEILAFKGGMMGGTPLDADELKALSKLPSREVLIGQLVGLAAAPIVGIVRSLGGLVGGLASQLGQIRDQGLVGQGVAAEEPAAAEEAPAEPAAEETAAVEEAVAEETTADAPAEEPAAEQDTTGEQADGEPAAEEAPDDKASAEGDADDGDAPADESNDDEGAGAENADA